MHARKTIDRKRTLKLSFAALLVLSTSGLAVAGPQASSASVCGSTGEDWKSDLSTATVPPGSVTHCPTLETLLKVFQQMDERDLPNSQASSPAKQPNYRLRIARTLRGVFVSESERSEACEMALHVTATSSDYSVALHAIEIVTLVDDPAGSCTRRVRQALHANAQAQEILEQAADLCASRKQAHCSQILTPDNQKR